MEAVPRLPMLNFDLKISPEPTSFGPKLKQYIRDFYHEDPEMYSNEIHTLEGLRASAVSAVRDVTGCSTLKKYYCQLHFLQNRFPMNKDGAAAVPFTWRDTYASMVCTLADIRFEMVAILYNIGALHSQLGASDSRVTADGMKMSCTHFQCAAWAFQHLKDSFPQPAGVDLAPDVMQFMYHLTLAQAQECILEKSMMDNRKATIIAKVAVQIVDYYNLALNTLEQGVSDDFSVSETVGSKLYKNWKRYVKFKIAYHTCVSLLYQGQQSEEQQKMGERVAYYQAASEKLEEAVKLSKGMENTEMVNECLAFTQDVVEGKKKAAKNENEFIYHEEVPDRDLLPDVKGASLVKGIAFSVNDPEVSEADIFARLVPMKAHEDSSLYSEEKAKLLRKVGVVIDEKDEELVSFMTSLQLEHLSLHSEPSTLPQELVDRCAALSAKPNAIQNLIDSMNKLADTYQDVEAMLQEIKEFLQMEEAKEKEYQEVMGKRPPSIVATDLTREANKYQEAHSKASESNQTLHKAMTLHISNLRVLAQPLSDLQKQIPTITSLDSPEDEAAVKEMKHLVGKVEEMKRQRAVLATQLRESICQDDITRQLVTRTTETLDNIFSQEMQKHQRYVIVIEQNLAAQENILKALTDAYARYAGTRKATNEIIRKREATINALISSYDAYEDLLAKSSKGLEFYRKLETNVSKLLQRVKGTCKVQEEERDQILAKNNKKLPIEKLPDADRLPTESSSGGPKLKDYLQSMKRGSAAVGGYGSTTDARYTSGVGAQSYGRLSAESPQPSFYDPAVPSTSTAQWIPTVRPAPVGSEGTGEQSSSLCTSNNAKQDLEESKNFSNFPRASVGYTQPASSTYISSSVPSSSQYPSSPFYPSQYSGTQQPTDVYSYSQQNYPSGYSNAINYSYSGQYQAPRNQDVSSDHTSSQVDKSYQPNSSLGTNTQTPNQYMARSASFQQHPVQPGYQQYATPQSYQEPSCSTSYTPSTSYAGSSFPPSQSGYPLPSTSQAVPVTSSYTLLPSQSSETSQSATSIPSQTNSYAQVHSYMGQTNFGYSAMNGTYQYNNSYPSSQSTNYNVPQSYSATPSQGTWQPQQPEASASYYAPDFHATSASSTIALSSGSSSEVSLVPQQPYYGPVTVHNQQSYPTASAAYSSQPSAISSTEYQYMQAPGASCYTSAGKYATSQTCSSQTSVEGQTFAAQYNASQGLAGYQPAAYGQGCYYNVPYGYQYADGAPVTASPDPQNIPTVVQQITSQQQQQQQQQTPQSPMTYMQARDPNQQTTTTTNCHGASSLSSSSSLNEATSSNVDLLAGLDFSLNQAPLTPSQTSVIPAKNEEPHLKPVVQSPIKPKPAVNISTLQPSSEVPPTVKPTEQSIDTVSADMETKPPTQPTVGVPTETAKSATNQPEILSKSEEVTECNDSQVESKQAQKVFGKDPYTDPEALNQFVQEVEKYEKFVVGLTTKTLNGPTPLDMKWKELLDLQEKDAHKRSISVARCYPMKNRFPDILPYDNSRVELPSTKDDYINASYMKELTPLTPPFILTQAPLPSTYTDFWTMVCEQQVEVVACLLSDAELLGQIYWPVEKGQEMAMGKMKLSLQSSNVRPHWVERILSISIADTRFTRVIIHLQFTAWPGSSFPASPGPFLSFVSEALNFYGQQRVPSHPVVVHCLSGVGRTGLFCLVAAALLDIQAGRGLLDLVAATANMSGYRKGSLRDREHLKFAYQSVLYFAQDLLMKWGILTSRSTFEDKRSRGGKSHTRHPSEDFLLGPPTDLSQLQSGLEKMGLGATNSQQYELTRGEEPNLLEVTHSKECSSSRSSSGRSSPYLPSPSSLLVDPARFNLKPEATSTKSRKRYTRENFTVKSKESSLEAHPNVSGDPLNQLDPFWSLKKS